MSIYDYIFGDYSRPSPRDGQSGLGPDTYICERCRNPFVAKLRRSGKLRDSIEYEPLRKKLMIQDPNYDPIFCDGCFLDIMSHETPKPMSTGLPGTPMPPVQRLEKNDDTLVP